MITPDETLAEEGAIEIEEADGAVRPATLVGRDPATDVALLRVEGANAPVIGLPTRPCVRARLR